MSRPEKLNRNMPAREYSYERRNGRSRSLVGRVAYSKRAQEADLGHPLWSDVVPVAV